MEEVPAIKKQDSMEGGTLAVAGHAVSLPGRRGGVMVVQSKYLPNITQLRVSRRGPRAGRGLVGMAGAGRGGTRDVLHMSCGGARVEA